MRKTVCLILLFALSGCAKPLTREESAFLTNIMGEIRPLSQANKELGAWPDNIERGSNFISYSRDLSSGANPNPLANPSYFWFKISLAEVPIEANEMQPPLLTIFMPQYKKFLKLRIVSSNRPLTGEIANIFLDYAVKAGGTDAHWGTGGAQPLSTRGRRGF